jgi:hypothetical protein
MPGANRFFAPISIWEIDKTVIDEKYMCQEAPELTGFILTVKLLG